MSITNGRRVAGRQQSQPPTFVLVEDDEGHAILIERTLRRYGIDNEVVRCRNGREAVELFFSGESRDRAIVVILDLHLPVLGGLQVLERLKENPATRAVPVVVLSTSENPLEVERCYQLGCSGYVTKPVDFENFGRAIHSIASFLTSITLA